MHFYKKLIDNSYFRNKSILKYGCQGEIEIPMAHRDKLYKKGFWFIKMSVNGKYVYNITIDTMADARKLVDIATKIKDKVLLQSGEKFRVNAKSFLGVVLAKKLNYNDLKLVMDEDHYHEFEQFIEE